MSHSISISTVQSIRRAYLQKLKSARDRDALTALPHDERGRSLLLGTLVDGKVVAYLKAIRQSGGVINRRIVIAVTLGIRQSCRNSLLVENGDGENGRTRMVAVKTDGRGPIPY